MQIYQIAPFIRSLPLPFKRAFNLFHLIKEHIFKVISEHKDSQVSGQPRDLIDCYLDEMEKVSVGQNEKAKEKRKVCPVSVLNYTVKHIYFNIHSKKPT